MLYFVEEFISFLQKKSNEKVDCTMAKTRKVGSVVLEEQTHQGSEALASMLAALG
jgi:hypothetical protein